MKTYSRHQSLWKKKKKKLFLAFSFMMCVCVCVDINFFRESQHFIHFKTARILSSFFFLYFFDSGARKFEIITKNKQPLYYSYSYCSFFLFLGYIHFNYNFQQKWAKKKILDNPLIKSMLLIMTMKARCVTRIITILIIGL